MAQFQDAKGFQVTVGFPEFTHGICNRYRAAFEALKRLEALQNKAFGKQLSEPFHKLVWHITKANANSLEGRQASLILVQEEPG